MDKERVAECINILGKFCGRRDISVLTKDELIKKYNIEQADVLVLFGGSILCGGDVLAEAMIHNMAKKYVIVGGAGHTTETLRMEMHQELPEIETAGLSEARVFAAYLKHRYNMEPDFIECNSTNCGNNITCLLQLLKENGIAFHTIILMQDATMQLRMDAGLRKYVPTDVTIINYAVYSANVMVKDGEFAYESDIWGMWDFNRYMTLLMGEIPRLSDDENGYGPKGKDYIAHVHIPLEVRQAFEELRQEFKERVREANPLYASVTETDSDVVKADASNLMEWARLSALLFPDEPFDELRKEYTEFLATQKEIGFLYQRDNQKVAFINVSVRHDYVNGTDTSPVAFIEALYVLPQYRQQGIARELIARAEAFAKESGITQLASDCLLENTLSEKFHKSCGFEEKERVICFVKKV